MKMFRLIGRVLMFVLLSVNLEACSNDNDEPEITNGNSVTKGKKLVEVIKMDDTTTMISVYNFLYDNNGRLSQIETEFYEKDNFRFIGTSNYNFNWIDNKLKITSKEWDFLCGFHDDIITEIIIDDGLSYDSRSFEYNQSKELSEYSSNGNMVCSYTWENGNIVTIDYGYSFSTISYSDIKNKGWWYPRIEPIGFGYPLHDAPTLLFMANSNLLGKQCSNLPKRITEGEFFWNFSFNVNEEGYVEKCIIVRKDATSTIYTYKWK